LAITQLQKQAIIYQILKIQGVGPVSFWKEFNRTQDFESTFKAFQSRFSIETSEDAAKIIEKYSQQGITCIGFWQSEYPVQLKRLHDVPPLLWVKGKIELLKNPQIAIVGGRNASFHGIKFAKDISESLSNSGFTIVSGLAKGIDKAAHQGALKNHTIAVLAGGVDKLYPQENADLYEELLAHHLIISEMSPGTEPIAELFPRRNRIIAALSSGIGVIEAAMKSGSLLTAKYALEIGVPIFACPGHPYDPRTRGANMLIKDGAYLLENIQDILDQVGLPQQPMVKPIEKTAQEKIKVNALSQEILNALSHTPIRVDELFKNFNQYSTEQILTALSELELKNMVCRPNIDVVTLR